MDGNGACCSDMGLKRLSRRKSRFQFFLDMPLQGIRISIGESELMVDLSVIIPAYNEAENLKVLIPELCRALEGISCEIIVVDNASKDHTQEVLKTFQKQIPYLKSVLEPISGYGRALLAGKREAKGGHLAIIRADNQETARDLVRIFRHLKENRLDFCKAIRASRRCDGMKRVVMSRIYNFLFRNVFHLKSRDINATPKVFTREFYTRSGLESLDWFLDAEIVIKAERLKCRIGEIKIHYYPRLKGVSTVKFKDSMEFVKNLFVWNRKVHHERFLAQ